MVFGSGGGRTGSLAAGVGFEYLPRSLGLVLCDKCSGMLSGGVLIVLFCEASDGWWWLCKRCVDLVELDAGPGRDVNLS